MDKKKYLDGLIRASILISMTLFWISKISAIAYVNDSGSQTLFQTILKIQHSFYEPNIDIQTNWGVNGSVTHFGAIDDAVRNDSVPNLSDYIYTSSQKGDQVGIPSLSESNIESIILWVYSETGSNAETTINLRNDENIVATLIIGPGSPVAWRFTVWENPVSVGSVSVEFSHSKMGGGKPTTSMVYAVYIEVVFTS